MQHRAPIELIVHYPATAAGKAKLSQQVGQIHADMINYRLRHMNIPTAQKLQLLDAITATVRIRRNKNVL